MWRLLEDFKHLHDVRVRRKSPQSLNFPQVIDLFKRGKVVFHAFDSNDFASFDALRLEHFAESAFTFLGNQSVLCLAPTMHVQYYY